MKTALFIFPVLLLCLPFAVLGFRLERDVCRVEKGNRVLKASVLLFFLLPFMGFSLLNFLAPVLSPSGRTVNLLLESFWVMEGRGPAILLLLMGLVFLVLYLSRVLEGDLRR